MRNSPIRQNPVDTGGALVLIRRRIVSFVAVMLLSTQVQALPDPVHQFIKVMVDKHGFDDVELIETFSRLEVNNAILRAISRPAESLSWYRYQKILVTDKRVKAGVQFWRDNRDRLHRVAQKYGVPEEIIVAIIGVETFFGQRQGKYDVLGSLYTLAFHYPPQLKRQRSAFFTRELEQFLLLCRSNNWAFDDIKGSYAGAMGMGQFIPSSYRAYAVDENLDGKRDLFRSLDDAIGSVANYFSRHHWQTGEPIAYPVRQTGSNSASLSTQGLRVPKKTVAELQSRGLQLDGKKLSPDTKAVLYRFALETDQEYWLTFKNFYVITRYNHSPLYALAVYQLSEAIKKSYVR